MISKKKNAIYKKQIYLRRFTKSDVIVKVNDFTKKKILFSFVFFFHFLHESWHITYKYK